MVCAQCSTEVKVPYAYTYKYNKGTSQWVETGGVVCGEVCGQLWVKGGYERYFWVTR